MEKLIQGEIAPFSCQYDIINENGTTVGTIYVKQGAFMPPTQNPTDYYEIHG